MKIVIDIPDRIYKITQNRTLNIMDDEILENALKNGTPLPEHHGRLIDADKLRETMEKDPRKALSFVDLTDFVWLAPTIIEAEGSESK